MSRLSAICALQAWFCRMRNIERAIHSTSSVHRYMLSFRDNQNQNCKWHTLATVMIHTVTEEVPFGLGKGTDFRWQPRFGRSTGLTDSTSSSVAQCEAVNFVLQRQIAKARTPLLACFNWFHYISAVIHICHVISRPLLLKNTSGSGWTFKSWVVQTLMSSD